MADQSAPTVTAPETNAPAVNPNSASVQPGVGPPDSPLARPPQEGSPPGPPSSGNEVDMSQVLSWAPDKSATLQDLAIAHEELKQLKSQGLDTYTQAMGGDLGAAKQYIEKLEQEASASQGYNPPASGSEAPPQPEVQNPEGWNEALQYINYARQRDIQKQLSDFLSQEPYKVLATRPGIVEDILVRLNQIQTQLPQGQSINPQTISHVVGEMAKTEKDYLGKHEEQWKKSNSGSLGVDGDPFRGGTPLQPSGPKPKYGDKKDYDPWLSRKFHEALRQDRMGQDKAAVQ